MQIEILDFIPDRESKNNRVGNVDAKITYENDNWEIFRNLCLYQKDNKRWTNTGFIKRDEKWAPRYERSKPIPFADILKALDEYLNKLA